MARDRTHIFPSHDGPNVLPNSPFFTKLLRHAHRRRIAIRDRELNVVKDYGDLLADALALRSVMKRKISKDSLAKLRCGDEVFIGILATGGYEFAVAMLAVLAIGAAAVPLSEYEALTSKEI